RRDPLPAARHRRHVAALARRAPRRRDIRRPDRGAAAASGRVRIAMDARVTSALLYLDGVTVSFDGFRALNKLSLAIAPGEMRAVIRPNAAGKTTMMDVVPGHTQP